MASNTKTTDIVCYLANRGAAGKVEMLSSFYQYINDNYGSKRGLCNVVKYWLLTHIGWYSHLKRINFSEVKRIVFVCSGNICRSPLGEYIAQNYGISAESFGLHCRGGDPADPRAIAFAKQVGVDMSKHITRNISDYVPLGGDLLVFMEPGQMVGFANIDNKRAQWTIATLWSRKKIAYLHDPFGSNEVFFNKCEQNLAEAVGHIAKKMGKSVSLS